MKREERKVSMILQSKLKTTTMLCRKSVDLSLQSQIIVKNLTKKIIEKDLLDQKTQNKILMIVNHPSSM